MIIMRKTEGSERSIEISSMELKELNGKLKRETEEESKEVFKQLKESLVLINEDNEEIIPSDLDYQKLSHLAGIVKGETEKRRIAEIELKNSEYRFRSLIENSADAIMIVNDRSEPVYLSTSVTRILGYKPEDVTNIPIYNFFHPNDFEELKDLFKRVYTNPERTYTTEYRVRKKEGNYIWVEGSPPPTCCILMLSKWCGYKLHGYGWTVKKPRINLKPLTGN